MTVDQINDKIKLCIIENEDFDTNKITDGFHTFGELYDHRVQLFITLINMISNLNEEFRGACVPTPVWKSKKHHDGSSYEGWFIAGINTEKGEQISYHLPINRWDDLKVEELEKAPEWDGHSSSDVVERLKQI